MTTDKQLIEAARVVANKAATEINEIHAHRIDAAEDVRPYCDALKSYANGLLIDADILHGKAAFFYARVEKPKRAAALDKLDEALRRLDRLRDIVARAIEDDAAVECSEYEAGVVADETRKMLEHIETAERFANIKKGETT